MRILEFTTDVPLELGGGGMMRHIVGLTGFLEARGHEVTIATARAPEGASLPPGFVRARGLGVIPLIRRADLVHVHGGRMVENALTAFLAWLLRKPFVYTPHAYYDTPLPQRPTPRQRLKHLLRVARKAAWDQVAERFLLGRGQRTILLAPFWVDYVRAKHLPAGRIAVIPNAIDLAGIEVVPRASGSLEGAPSLLTVGRLDEVKHVDDIVRALAEPGMEAAVLHVVGTGPDRPRIEEAAWRAGVPDRVRWHGFVDDHEVARMMAGAHVFVIASRQEGLPTTVLEALTRGTPVVASDIPPHRHILEIAGERSLFPLGDATALARMAQLVTGRDVPEGARERIRQAFSWDMNAPLILDVYEAAARRSS